MKQVMQENRSVVERNLNTALRHTTGKNAEYIRTALKQCSVIPTHYPYQMDDDGFPHFIQFTCPHCKRTDLLNEFDDWECGFERVCASCEKKYHVAVDVKSNTAKTTPLEGWRWRLKVIFGGL